MRLSLRLLLLGISGPLVSLAIFLVLATIGSIRLAQKAQIEINSMFDHDNLSSLSVTTSIIQKSASAISQDIFQDSQELRAALAPLRLEANGRLTWKGQSLTTAEAPAVLNEQLRLPLAMPQERAAVYYRDRTGTWRRLAGITSRGKALKPGAPARPATVSDFEHLFKGAPTAEVARNTMVQMDGEWRMARLTLLSGRKPGEGHLALLVDVSTQAASQLLAAGSSLFPTDTHQAAFFGISPTGALYCSYQTPGTEACVDLAMAMRQNGGVPDPRALGLSRTFERKALVSPLGTDQPVQQHLYIATFPEWNWLAVVSVEEEALADALVPMQEARDRMVRRLVVLTLILIGASGVAAWLISRGIQRQLRELATAADAIADGQDHQALTYPADDAIGRLVRAFNRMSGAVADRESSLRAQIRQMEIDINASELQGQVCSILNDPGFEQLSARAQAMRQRRLEQISASGPSASAAAGSAGDGPPPREGRDQAEQAGRSSG
ncbi:MAG: HAMP domain-containing protein [Aphanothece saxicola GSE-SYN-MK-01-06B]|jgi:HAMP domain-containing protein|nr:HAMP domain-containing protein [Aphanothece saxicola GSE-SYN-MK-01-06B]